MRQILNFINHCGGGRKSNFNIDTQPTPAKNLLKRKGMNNQKDHDLMVYEEHSEIYKAVHDANLDNAVKVMERHLSRSFKSSLIIP